MEKLIAGFVGVMSAVEARLLKRIEPLEQRQPQVGPPGPPGADGKDGAQGAPGRDGKDGEPGVNGKDGSPGENGQDGKDGRDGKDGEPGAPGLAGKEGAQGPSGLNGKDGAQGQPGERGERGEKGYDGRNGKDGLGFDDLEMVHDGERGFVFRFSRGDHVKEFPFTVPSMIYRGVYVEARTYVRGDVVTFGGSTWHSNEDTVAKPGDGSKAWTLMVKKGRDGRDTPVVKVGGK